NTSTLENRSTSVSKKGPHIQTYVPTPGIDDEGRCDIGADVSHHIILDALNTVSNDVSIDKTQTPRGQMPEKETGGLVSFQVLFKDTHSQKGVYINQKAQKLRVRIFRISHEEGQNQTKMNTRRKEYTRAGCLSSPSQ
ncbi:hypothetical protein Tco_1443861, partial [Tanacetum coccineum]